MFANKICIKYKPSNPEASIAKLTEEIHIKNQKIKELEDINSKLKSINKKMKSNIIARQVLDRDMDKIIEI
ncbi:2936_t:CDS:2 [Scutellospora calospora]|uniref:2936_t:CDS:1 n=1 Tax=Scutellospora calospora TaxID=85575 RepID=A0ACA9K727_9GLOM|nr:2936_t:CDS:2 [Scutellospora calospora]